ncbi:MAG: hypothetical protein AABX72_00110 [Nanoarchaeota archaeon]
MKRKCKECQGLYETKDQSITIIINHKDIEALEDALFCTNTDEEWRKMLPKVSKIWKQICHGEDKWK